MTLSCPKRYKLPWFLRGWFLEEVHENWGGHLFTDVQKNKCQKERQLRTEEIVGCCDFCGLCLHLESLREKKTDV